MNVANTFGPKSKQPIQSYQRTPEDEEHDRREREWKDKRNKEALEAFRRNNSSEEHDVTVEELKKLIEDMGPEQAAQALIGLTTGLSLQDDRTWLRARGPDIGQLTAMDSGQTGWLDLIMESADALTNVKPAATQQHPDSLVPQLTALRDEAQGLFPEVTREYGVLWTLLGKYRQAIGNVILWYGQWEKNRDYSSAINASMALGKLSSMNDLMPQEEAGSFNTSDCDKVAKAVDKLCTECWDRIQAATGRIVPFEKG